MTTTNENHVKVTNENRAIKNTKNDTPFLYFCAVTASLLVFSGCSCIVWSSPVIPKLKSTDPEENPLDEPITSFEIALITGLPSFVAILGNLFFAKMPSAIGRKNTLLFLSCGMLLSLVIVSLARHVYVYSAALCFLFICVAGVYVALPLYLSEISEDHNRGRIVSIMGVLMPLGNLYGYLLGPIFSVPIYTMFLALPLVIQLILVALFLPESPVFLVTKNQSTAALLSLIKLRGNKNAIEIDDDLKNIENSLKDTQETLKKNGLLDLFRSRSVRRALVISLVINMTQQLSGVISILKFLGPVFNEVSENFSGNNVAILVGTVKFVSFFICSMVVEKVGRRPLLLASSLGSGISLLLIGLFFFLKHRTSILTSSITWLPILFVVIFNFMYALGVGTLSITVMNEVFPTSIKAIGSASVFTLCYLLGASQVFLFPIITENYGVHVCIWSFSFCCFLGFFSMLVLLPETKGKSFLEIEELLGK
ncbi:unnamed protein product [Psylliodes chrysocephalus]|uniref:Major facilitator superfamily (MFS) profile domain-containing protein n=1 Tax=Psylliodes chrysocephalus TaxID=3402493 RepID=A0A9P0GF09_9CUCU|nr:unnamed protein product [Psylliodes chrysocephala]